MDSVPGDPVRCRSSSEPAGNLPEWDSGQLTAKTRDRTPSPKASRRMPAPITGLSRTALLVRCSTEQAHTIRLHAEKERRTVSGYVLNIVLRAVEVEDRLFSRLNRYPEMNKVLSRTPLTTPGPRTAILVRCYAIEASRIRESARRREIGISAFVMQALRRAWNVQNAVPKYSSKELVSGEQ